MCVAHSSRQIALRRKVGVSRPRSLRSAATTVAPPPPPRAIPPEHTDLLLQVSKAIERQLGDARYESQIYDVMGAAMERMWKIYLRWDPARSPLEAWLWSHLRTVKIDILRDVSGYRRVHQLKFLPSSDLVFHRDEEWGMN